MVLFRGPEGIGLKLKFVQFVGYILEEKLKIKPHP